jgi:hypothetical protein
MSTWTEWKRFPNPLRGEQLEAPIGPGLYEVRFMSSGALFGFSASDNVAQALATLPAKPGLFRTLFGKHRPMPLHDLEYRTCATPTREIARITAAHLAERRDAFVSGAA